jgi:hypothetical protein
MNAAKQAEIVATLERVADELAQAARNLRVAVERYLRDRETPAT